jgi:hypothetical protein
MRRLVGVTDRVGVGLLTKDRALQGSSSPKCRPVVSGLFRV